MNSELNKEYEASLKSIETENFIDRIFYRPIGFRVARALLPTSITPNMVTVTSIFVGASAGWFFHYSDIMYNVYGILLLMLANILDCADGQLARLSGNKSTIGRILDGFAGDIWFLVIYVSLAFRLSREYGESYFYAVAVVSGLSHMVQANITDYYKTLHLYFISKEKGYEFQTQEQVRMRHKATKLGVNKSFYLLYGAYTLLQEAATPTLQRLLGSLRAKYGDDIPADLRLALRQKSLQLMSIINMMTFNGRTMILFIVLFTGYVWIYLAWEIIVLNIVLAVTMKKHERMCATFL
jgi:hypothetical protein